MILEDLRSVFVSGSEKPFVVEPHGVTSWAAWLRSVATADLGQIAPGDVVAVRARTTSAFIATLWALLERRAIVGLVGAHDDIGQRAALLDADWALDDGAAPARRARERSERHELFRRLASVEHPGIVLFSSGTTGAPKSAVHDATRFLSKFASRRKDLRTLLFLSLDHVGGLDTLFYAMSNASSVVVPASRAVDHVCEAIAAHRVEVLPCNPSFLSLLLLQRGAERYDLTSLRTITYGAEVMPEATLARVAATFPWVEIRQKYGSTEFGALRSSSRAADSPWLKLGGENVELRVQSGMLEVKAPTAMLGYLDGPSPISADGWVATGDFVERDGEYYRIIGRGADMINVGGEKVFPAEVENALLQLRGVVDARVYGEANLLLGQVVVAEIVYDGEEQGGALTTLVKRHCMASLAAYKVPARVRVVQSLAMGDNKKVRSVKQTGVP